MATATTSGGVGVRAGAGVGGGVAAEASRLAVAGGKATPWRRWGPYLAERQWGTVREDYSTDGGCWGSFPHDHARSRAYRWGEDGLLGICDDDGRLCFALALWNGKDPILKERLFGLTGPEGNHGEDVKEHYFYLDSTPTHSYVKGLYKYPQGEFPYARLVEESARRGRGEREFEIGDAGVFDGGRYFDVQVEYAKAGPEDVLIRVTVTNRGPEAAVLHLLPTLWFKNTWSWRLAGGVKPTIEAVEGGVRAADPALGDYLLSVGAVGGAGGGAGGGVGTPELLFTENETNKKRLWGVESDSPWVKDAFHERVVRGEAGAVNPAKVGTKAAAWYVLEVPAGGSTVVRLRLARGEGRRAAGITPEFDRVFEARVREADEFYAGLGHDRLGVEERRVARQAAAGLLWSKQFYHYDVAPWLDGDPGQPRPPEGRKSGRNADWRHLNNRDVISMPDKWEYPWYAAWDLAFHTVPLAKLDPQFAKDQLVLLLREWYMHPSGQIPAYEFAFGDVNPPVHAWAVWRVYKMTGERGERDRVFLARCFQKLLLNFTWWVNRKDPQGKNVFGGGFLGMDNVGVFDRSQPLPTGGHLEQADGTAWMAFFCGTMLSMALELAAGDPAYEDIATKFFEHFIAITDAINTLGGRGLWDEEDGFYYDQINPGGGQGSIPLKVRSLVGVVPLLAVEVLEGSVVDKLPDFKGRMEWFLKHRRDLPWHATCACAHGGDEAGGAGGAGGGVGGARLLAIPTREQLARVVTRLMEESEFLSPYGVRSMSRAHGASPFCLAVDGERRCVEYAPGESTSEIFGGNSNWRGPIWFPLNYLIIEALERYHHFYGETLRVPIPDGAGGSRAGTLQEAADEVRARLTRLFLPDGSGARPCHGEDRRFAEDPAWRELIYFYEHFHGETGRGLGASHQTGWTALVLQMLRPGGREGSGRTERS